MLLSLKFGKLVRKTANVTMAMPIALGGVQGAAVKIRVASENLSQGVVFSNDV